MGGIQSDAGNMWRHEVCEPGVQLIAAEQDAVDAPCEFVREDGARDRLAHEMDVPAEAVRGQVLENAGVGVAPVLVGERQDRQDGGRMSLCCHDASVPEMPMLGNQILPKMIGVFCRER